MGRALYQRGALPARTKAEIRANGQVAIGQIARFLARNPAMSSRLTGNPFKSSLFLPSIRSVRRLPPSGPAPEYRRSRAIP